MVIDFVLAMILLAIVFAQNQGLRILGLLVLTILLFRHFSAINLAQILEQQIKLQSDQLQQMLMSCN
jgi:hypothetical protein